MRRVSRALAARTASVRVSDVFGRDFFEASVTIDPGIGGNNGTGIVAP